jgi:hypothetical protein
MKSKIVKERYDYSYFSSLLMLMKIVVNFVAISHAQVEVTHVINKIFAKSEEIF